MSTLEKIFFFLSEFSTSYVTRYNTSFVSFSVSSTEVKKKFHPSHIYYLSYFRSDTFKIVSVIHISSILRPAVRSGVVVVTHWNPLSGVELPGGKRGDILYT